MAESNKYSLDDFPNEIILKILGNVDGLADRSNVAQVSHRFNRLIKEKNWRRGIFISPLQLQKFSISHSTRSKFVEKLMEDIDTLKRLEMLTIEFPTRDIYRSDTRKNIRELFAMIKGKMEELSNFDGICSIRFSDLIPYYIFFFTPKFADADAGRLVRYPPVSSTFIKFVGKETTKLENILEFSKEFVGEYLFRCPITLPLLKKLGECKNLKDFGFSGELTLPPNFNEIDLPKISSKRIHLCQLGCSQLSDQTSKIASIFFSDVLSHFYIPFSLLQGSETEICSSCPNLKCLHIEIGNVAVVTDEIFSEFCDKLLTSVNNHLELRMLEFSNMEDSFENILHASRHTKLTKKPSINWTTIRSDCIQMVFNN